jgi:hypothetical protein
MYPRPRRAVRPKAHSGAAKKRWRSHKYYRSARISENSSKPQQKQRAGRAAQGQQRGVPTAHSTCLDIKCGVASCSPRLLEERATHSTQPAVDRTSGCTQLRVSTRGLVVTTAQPLTTANQSASSAAKLLSTARVGDINRTVVWTVKTKNRPAALAPREVWQFSFTYQLYCLLLPANHWQPPVVLTRSLTR